MRIVFFSHYFPPEVNAPASRTADHCRIWAREGHDVTVVTCAPNHPSGEVYPGYRNRLFQTEIYDGVRVIRIWTFLAANEGFLWRSVNYLSYLLSATLALPRLPRADVVISTSPQFFCGLAGMMAKYVTRTPWVLEIRDLWPESILAVGAMREGALVRWLERLETLAYRKADHVVALTNSFVPHISARRGKSEGISVIENGADLSFFLPAPNGESAKRSLGIEARFVAAYVGTHGLAHGLETILDAADRLRDRPDILFLLVGDGADRARIERMRMERALDNVRLLGQRPKAEMPEIWGASDVSLILLRRREEFSKVIPSKMFEAMAMRRPIILGVEGEARLLLEQAGAGIAVTPESAEELVAAVRRLADDPELAETCGARGAHHVRANYDRETLARRYLDLLQATVPEKRGNRKETRGLSVEVRNLSGIIARAARSFAFARHIPLVKVARRLELEMRRRWRERWPATFEIAPPPGRCDTPPLPLCAPRKGKLSVDGRELAFVFLGREKKMQREVLDWGASSPGPDDQLWRMNLHYMEYLEEADDALLQELILGWIDANPVCGPGSWRDAWSSYAVSIRVVVWMQQLAARADRLPQTFCAEACRSLAQQVSFLERNLETDIGGNHLIKNIKALLWASAFFEGPHATRWREKGSNLLDIELRRQILDDGVHYERSPSYHCQVLVDLLECRWALGAELERLDPILRAMAQASVDLTHPDGGVCLFNDSGLTMAYSSAQCLAAYARLFDDLPSPRSLFAFADAGYFGARLTESYVVVDCGAIAPDDLPAHGHGDVLSFEWSVKDRRIVVDQGVYEYVAGRRRQQARAAASHNTLCFRGTDQADFFGAFRCGRRARVEVRSYEARENGFSLEGAHDGFRNLPGAPRHLRRFDVTSDEIVVRDRIEGKTDRLASIGFLLHPSVEVSIEGRSARIMSGEAEIAVTSSFPILCEDAVWWPDMGQERETRRLSVHIPAGASETVTTFRII